MKSEHTPFPLWHMTNIYLREITLTEDFILGLWYERLPPNPTLDILLSRVLK